MAPLLSEVWEDIEAEVWEESEAMEFMLAPRLPEALEYEPEALESLEAPLFSEGREDVQAE